MAYGGTLKPLGLTVNIDSSSLVNFTKMLKSLNQDRGLEKYWKTSEELIQDAIVAYEKFTKVASNDNATELLKVVNALKAIENTNLSGLSNVLPNFENMAKGINKALSQIDLNEAFSADSFKEAFASFDMLKAADVDMEKLFSRFKNSSEVNELRNVIENLNDELLKTRNNLEGVISEKENIQREFNNLADNSGFSELKSQIVDLEDEIRAMKISAEKEFTDFLKANGFQGYDITNNNMFSEYFDGINNGYLSANEAIAKFRLEHNDLLKSMFKESGDNLGIERLQEFANKLDEVFKKTEEISKNITNIMTNGVISKASANMLEQDIVPESYEDTFRKMSEGSSNLSSTLDVLVKIINETTGASTNMNDMYSSIAHVFSAIKDVSSIELDNLSALYGVVSSLSKLNDLKIDKTPLENLAVALERLVKIENPTALNTISNVNLNRFNELKVSKASLNNLAEYLPKIASVNYRDLIELTNLDFSKLSENLTINKSAIQSLIEFTNGLKESDVAKQFVDNNKNVDSSAEESSKSIKTEAELMESIAKNATTAANAKREFANANKDVKKSADDSIPSLNNESKAMDNVNRSKGGKKKDSKTDTSNTELQKKKYDELSSAIDRLAVIKVRSAKGSALHNDISEAEKLLGIIQEIKKSGVISDDAINKSNQKLAQLGTRLVDILQQNSQKYLNDIDKLFKKYETGFSKLSNVSDSDRYKEELKSYKHLLEVYKEVREEISNIPVVSSYSKDEFSTIVELITLTSNRLKGISDAETKEQKVNYDELCDKLGRYEKIRKRIAGGKALEGDSEEADKLLKRILELNKSGVISDDNLKKSTQRLRSLGNELADSLKKRTSEFFDEIDKKIKSYESKQSSYDSKKSLFKEDNEDKQNYSSNFDNFSKGLTKLKSEYSDKNNFTFITNEIENNINGLIDSLDKSSKELDATLSSKADNQKEKYKQLNEELKKYEKLLKDIAHGNSLDGDSKEAERLLGIIQDLSKEDIISDEAIENVRKRFKNLSDEIYRIFSVNSKKYEESLEKYKNQKPNEEFRSPEYKTAINSYSEAIDNLKIKIKEISELPIISKDEVLNIIEFEKAVKNAETKIKSFSAVDKGLNLQSASKTINDINKYLNTNTNISKQAKSLLRAYIEMLENGNYQNLATISNGFRDIQIAERDAHREGKKFFDIIKDKYTYGFAAQFAGYFLSVSDFMRYASQGFSVIREFDTALTELKKVSDETNHSLENFQKHSFAIANSVGTTATQLQQSTADYMRLGRPQQKLWTAPLCGNI